MLVGKSTQNDLKFGFTQDKCVITSQQTRLDAHTN